MKKTGQLLTGVWQATLSDGATGEMILPGTLDENAIGYKDYGENQWHPAAELGNDDQKFTRGDVIRTRFTRKYTYEGAVSLVKRIRYQPTVGKRVFFEVERARCLKLLIDGQEIKPYRPLSLSTPAVFEVTGYLSGDNEIMFIVDNSYPGLPREDIVYSSVATDETQTNWNGLIGDISIREEEDCFISSLSVYPQGSNLRVKVEIDTADAYEGEVKLESEVLKQREKMTVKIEKPGKIVVSGCFPLASAAKQWDIDEGNMYSIKARLRDKEDKAVSFGIREFKVTPEGYFMLNDHRVFLLSEANCAVFPETGYPPMQAAGWQEIILRYKSYGVNCLRFHSWCPPEAAFAVADQLGMLMQPELSHWNPRDAFLSPKSYDYYRTELVRILETYANHPSFVMLTFGNELCTDQEGHDRMTEMLHLAKYTDRTRLYANGSNIHYGQCEIDPENDFYTAQKYMDVEIRGTFSGDGSSLTSLNGFINNEYPDTRHNFDKAIAVIRQFCSKPVYSFEVGQFEVLPEFSEIADFKGVTSPFNYQAIEQEVIEKGLQGEWHRYVEATGEIALLAYREEVEAALRTKEMSGISLLGIQDFPGQGTALVGMLNSHLQPKPYDFAKPERFAAFFRTQLPLVLLEKYTYAATETLNAEIEVANYGKNDLQGQLCYELKGQDFCYRGKLAESQYKRGELSKVGRISISLSEIKRPVRLTLTVTLDTCKNSYLVWVYPETKPDCPESVYEACSFDEQARQVLKNGGTVFLAPPSTKESLPHSIMGQFTTDFWSVGTFANQEGGMGQLIDANHPIFREFPTESHSNWQWWAMATRRAMILPKQMKSIITEMDSYAYLRPMSKLIEARCENGRLLISSMGLQDLQEYPEARALLSSIYRYLGSEEFCPQQSISPEEVKYLVN